MPESQPLLLSIVEIGGYPDFTALYQQLGLQVEKHTSMRKVLQFLLDTVLPNAVTTIRIG